MFTGIIETLGRVVALQHEGTNVHLVVESPLAPQLKIDQSVSHNGVCLTVVQLDADRQQHTVTAVQETLDRTNIGQLRVGDVVNLERCTVVGGRLDGHIVQGHVDQTAVVDRVDDRDGSWSVWFRFAEPRLHVMVPKGSVTVSGVSLTVVEVCDRGFSVAIIPYTWQHTNFHTFAPGTVVNIEFDVIGKYVERMMAGWQEARGARS